MPKVNRWVEKVRLLVLEVKGSLQGKRKSVDVRREMTGTRENVRGHLVDRARMAVDVFKQQFD